MCVRAICCEACFLRKVPRASQNQIYWMTLWATLGRYDFHRSLVSEGFPRQRQSQESDADSIMLRSAMQFLCAVGVFSSVCLSFLLGGDIGYDTVPPRLASWRAMEFSSSYLTERQSFPGFPRFPSSFVLFLGLLVLFVLLLLVFLCF